MFQVIWLQTALDELATAWTQADSTLRKAITEAVRLIDQALETAPEEQGESRDQGRRIYFQVPLGITFTIDDTTSTVRVLHVWTIRERS
jgi:hypothetical protein